MSDQLEQALWAFSLTVYGCEGVREECLDLQGRFDVDVNLLLFCTYLGAEHGVILTRANAVEAYNTVRSWHADIVTQLRQIRRSLKLWGTDKNSLMAAESEQLRAKIKAIELESERIEQTMLAQWALPRLNGWSRGEANAAARSNVATLLQTYGVQDTHPVRLIGAALATLR
jgi:uncharacterized protein (TIGR02444 family)